MQTGLIDDNIPVNEQPTMEEIDDDEEDDELQSEQDEQGLDGPSEMYYQS